MTQTQEAQEATLRHMARLLSDIASRGSEVQGILQRSTSVDDIVRRTTDFLRSHGARLEAALGDKRANALVNLMDALVEAQNKTRTEAQESMTRLLGLVRQGEALLDEPLRGPRLEAGTYKLGERSPRVSQGEIPT